MLLRTDRLDIRPWRPDEADRVLDTYSRWEVARWLGAQPRAMADLDEARAKIAQWTARNAEDPRFGIWAVEVRDTEAGKTGIVAGTVLYKPLPNGDGEVEVGWHLHPDSWGHGYATEAARAVVERGFGLGIPEVYAVVYPGNEPSMAVCRRLGMTHLGRTDRWYGVELDAYRVRENAEHGPP